MNLQFLKAALAGEFAGQDDAAILAALNAPTVEYFVPVPTADVHNFLVNSGLYGKLLDAYRNNPTLQIRIVAETALDAVMGQIPEINLAANGAIAQGMQALVMAHVFTQAEADSVLALAKRRRSRAESEFGAALTQPDIARARLLDKRAAQAELVTKAQIAVTDAQAALDAARQALAIKQAVLGQFDAGVDGEVG